LRSKRHSVVDIRIIAATNQNLKALVTENKFREDLYYRLNVTHIWLPPLRERKEDIPLLIEHFLQNLNIRSKSKILGFTDKAMQCLLQYTWPGNIRELKNLLEALSVVNSSQYIKSHDLPESIYQFLSQDNHSLDEKDLLLSTLLSTNWNKSKAAEKLHWSRMTVYRKIEKYQIGPGQ
jgi:transcriptional regulator with PAS, ATPase and Fis domain